MVKYLLLLVVLLISCSEMKSAEEQQKEEQADRLYNRIHYAIRGDGSYSEFSEIKNKLMNNEDTLFHLETVDFSILIRAKKDIEGKYVEVPNTVKDTIIKVESDWEKW